MFQSYHSHVSYLLLGFQFWLFAEWLAVITYVGVDFVVNVETRDLREREIVKELPSSSVQV